MISGSLAKRYARALLDLASSPAQRDKFDTDLHALAAAMSLPDELGHPIHRTLATERFPLSQRQALATALCRRVGGDAMLTKFVSLLVERGRIVGIEEIARTYRVLADERAGRVRARVTSAQALAPDAVQRVKTALEQATGKTVLLDSAVDPELIGGLVTEVGSLRLDRSVKTQLSNLRATLLEDA